MALRAALIAIHAGTVLGPALVITAFAPVGASPYAFPRLVGGGGPWVVAILVLAVVQAVAGALLGLRNLRGVTPVGVHVIGPTMIAWVGLAGATLGVASAGDALGGAAGAGALNPWAASLARADLPRQFGFLVAGWGWLAALATITLGAFSRRGGAPRKPGYRLAIIAAGCTLPTVVLLIGGDMVALRSGVFLVASALAAGGSMALAAPTISVWSVSGDAPSRNLAFSTIWLSGCAAVVAVAAQGLALSWQAQSAALTAAVLSDSRAPIVDAARAQTELATEATYLAAGLVVAWLALAMRGRRVVLSAPSQNIGSVLVTLLLAASVGVANNLFEHGASRRHEAVLGTVVSVAAGIELPPLPGTPRRLATVVRVNPDDLSVRGTPLATRENGEWLWLGDAALQSTDVLTGDADWQRALCGKGGKEVGVAAPGSMAAGRLLEALSALRAHGICRVEILGRQSTLPIDEQILAPWIAGVVEARLREPHAISFFLAASPPDGATVVEVDGGTIEPPAGEPVVLAWKPELTLEQALALAPAPYAVLLLPR